VIPFACIYLHRYTGRKGIFCGDDGRNERGGE
jgi:hypothetical protein